MSTGGVNILLVAYKGDRWLPVCVGTLAQRVRAPFHLWLVDNVGNTCLDRLGLEELPHQLLRCQAPMGFAEANNFALVHGAMDADYVCFLNQDTISEGDWMANCIGQLEHNRRIGAATPRLRTYNDDGDDPNFLACARKSEACRRDLERGSELEACYLVPEITAAAMVIRGDLLRRIGPFDPIYGSYYEDYDLCRRVREAGYELAICGQARVRHFSGSATDSPAAEGRRARTLVRNRCIYEVRSGGSRLGTVLRHLVSAFPRNLVRTLLGRPAAKPLGALLAGYADLLPLAWRLVSARRDDAAWRKYLKELGWPLDSELAA